MKFRKRCLVIILSGGFLLGTSGCADDNLSKGLVIAGLAGGGAFIGGKLIASQGNRTMGYILGAIGGALAGSLITGGSFMGGAKK